MQARGRVRWQALEIKVSCTSFKSLTKCTLRSKDCMSGCIMPNYLSQLHLWHTFCLYRILFSMNALHIIHNENIQKYWLDQIILFTLTVFKNYECFWWSRHLNPFGTLITFTTLFQNNNLKYSSMSSACRKIYIYIFII